MTQMLKLQELRNAIHAQIHDSNWFLITAKLTGIPTALQFDMKYWDPTWGGLCITDVPESKPEVLWQRPDGGGTLKDVNEVDTNIQIIRFALQGELIKTIKALGELTFAKAGYPNEWNRCKVYVNGAEISHVVMADAILNRCEVIALVQGRAVTVNDEVKTKILQGNVQIKVDNQLQTFF